MRVCKLCLIEFELHPGRGRPRLYCYTCEPIGWQLVKVRGRPEATEAPPGPAVTCRGLKDNDGRRRPYSWETLGDALLGASRGADFRGRPVT